MTKPKTPMVAVSNHLIKAGFQLSEWEHRIVNIAASQIEKGAEVRPDTPFIIRVDELRDLFSPGEQLYQAIARATRRLMRRVIAVRYSPEGREVVREKEFHWITEADYSPAESAVAIYWSPRVIPYLTELNREFTQYNMQQITKLDGKWAPRLFQLVMSWRTVGHLEMSIEELLFALDAPKTYSNVSQLKTYVLQPALWEILDKLPDLKLTMSERRRGRKISHIQFKFVPSKASDEYEEEQIDWVDESASETPVQPRGAKTPQSAAQADGRADWQKAKDAKRAMREKLRDIHDLDW